MALLVIVGERPDYQQTNVDNPIQPIVDDSGTKRFKANKIVRYILDHGGINMNDIARLDFDQSDREQFAQLIGYSLGGFSELSYVRDTTYETAVRIVEQGKTEEQAKIEVLEEKLAKVRELLRQLVPEVFRIHPDDLIE